MKACPCDDHLCCVVSSQSAHRSQPVFELAVVSFDRVVGVLLDVTPCRRDQLVEHAGVDRSGVGDDFAGHHLPLARARWKNRRAGALALSHSSRPTPQVFRLRVLSGVQADAHPASGAPVARLVPVREASISYGLYSFTGPRSPAAGVCPASPCGRRPGGSTTPRRPWTGAPSRASRVGACTSPSGTTTPGTTTARANPTHSRPADPAASTFSNTTAELQRQLAERPARPAVGNRRVAPLRGPGTGRAASWSGSASVDWGKYDASRPSGTSAVTAHSTSWPASGRPATSGCTRGTVGAAGPAPSGVGHGLEVLDRIVGAGDLNGDERVDVVARSATTGELFLYPGTGRVASEPSVRIGHRLGRLQPHRRAGDFSGNGRATSSPASVHRLPLALPGQRYGQARQSASALAPGGTRMTAIMSPGDFNGDRSSDLARPRQQRQPVALRAHGNRDWKPRSWSGHGLERFQPALLTAATETAAGLETGPAAHSTANDAWPATHEG